MNQRQSASGRGATVNAFTVDVEDYFQVSAFEGVVDRSAWREYPSRVEANTHHILDMLERHGICATFFCLGWVAEHFPDIIREIDQRGHEVACHGYSHRLIYEQTPAVFREETLRSKRLLEDITGKPVYGYRAASYSITPQSLWALDILVEAGFTYDSSIFPISHDRYGVADAQVDPHLIKTPKGYSLPELSLSTYQWGPLRLPVAGGGYFRLFPYWLTEWALGQLEKQGRPFVFYMHPWEIDPEQPRFEQASRLSRFRHYNNLALFEPRLEKLFRRFSFGPAVELMQNAGFSVLGEASA